MRWTVLAVGALTMGCGSAYGEETTPTLPSRSEVTETAPASPAPAAPAAPAPVDARSFCVQNADHGQCFDFDGAEPFKVITPPGKPAGTCTVVETETRSAPRSLLCENAAGEFGLALDGKLDLRLEGDVMINAPTRPKTTFAFFDLYTLRPPGEPQPQIDFAVTFEDGSPEGRIDFTITEVDPATQTLAGTRRFPTKVGPTGWHHFALRMRKADQNGTIAITAIAEGVVVFEGTLAESYPDLQQLRGAVGSDAGWNATNGSAPVFVDNILVD